MSFLFTSFHFFTFCTSCKSFGNFLCLSHFLWICLRLIFSFSSSFSEIFNWDEKSFFSYSLVKFLHLSISWYKWSARWCIWWWWFTWISILSTHIKHFVHTTGFIRMCLLISQIYLILWVRNDYLRPASFSCKLWHFDMRCVFSFNPWKVQPPTGHEHFFPSV